MSTPLPTVAQMAKEIISNGRCAKQHESPCLEDLMSDAMDEYINRITPQQTLQILEAEGQMDEPLMWQDFLDGMEVESPRKFLKACLVSLVWAIILKECGEEFKAEDEFPDEPSGIS